MHTVCLPLSHQATHYIQESSLLASYSTIVSSFITLVSIDRGLFMMSSEVILRAKILEYGIEINAHGVSKAIQYCTRSIVNA